MNVQSLTTEGGLEDAVALEHGRTATLSCESRQRVGGKVTRTQRWCKGRCERELALEHFPRDGRGRYGRTCKVCLRRRKRTRYGYDRAFRERIVALHKDWYARNAVRERAKQQIRDQAKKLEE